MMVTFVSQCEKNALKKTRRVLDAFADRIGDNTWQTVITEEGLKTVRKMLRQTASKSTAVSCHWIRSRSRSQLLWVVGNRSKFDGRGVVPVNYTENSIEQFMDGYQWRYIKTIEYAVAIAGLFHDFGKATVLFQAKIDPQKKETEKFEPFRHEWVSLRLFQSFVGDMNDLEWLEKLSQTERDSISEFFKDGLDGNVTDNHPLDELPPFARLIAWLILTHHKLPIYPEWKEDRNTPPQFEYIEEWFSVNFEASWNSFLCDSPDQLHRLKDNWRFAEPGLPYQSMHWRSTACFLASEAKTILTQHLTQEPDWLNENLFTTHIARLCLMLADHYYSAQEENVEKWRSPNYVVWANTDKNKIFKQRLDEHLLGVAYFSREIAKAIPRLNRSLHSLEGKKILEQTVKKDKRLSKRDKDNYVWQDHSTKLAEKIGKATIGHGFFGINMASTGKGKTLANAKIMYAMGAETGRTRFNVALGLRTLTLQTGREYRRMLGLSTNELGIVVGGAAVKQLFENNEKKQSQYLNDHNSADENSGSESCEALLEDDFTIDYTDEDANHNLAQWTRQEKNLDKLIVAPVLVCTIDHLIPASEGTKGGKQIAPMLRLLTSDLVLDEPDDFGLEDLPALCRLVHWAGMLGSRVLLSTATMPPALSYALFQAYYDGWRQFAQFNIPDWDKKITCAWFDEFEQDSNEIEVFSKFKTAHETFIKKRIKKLSDQGVVQRKGKIIDIEQADSANIIDRMAQTIQKYILELHQLHHQHKDNHYLSVGLVRMANINPLVVVGLKLLGKRIPDNDTCIHYCLYHSRYPLAIRSYMENKLDRILKRKDPDKIWEYPEIETKIRKSPCKSHIFVVLASPVAEVGRDHDYDWAIVEPSSMRSIIQLAGRVLRHREKLPPEPNILILNENYKALNGNSVCFEKPGFETRLLKLNGHDLKSCLRKEQIDQINAVSRIILPEKYETINSKYKNLVELEHKALVLKLISKHNTVNAKAWWEHHPQWCGEVQRQQRFRKSPQDEAYHYWITNEYRHAKWLWKNEHVRPAKFGEPSAISIENIKQIDIDDGNDFWFELNAKDIYQQLADDLGIDALDEVSRRFGEVRLVEWDNNAQAYKYHSNLGLFREIGGNE